MLTKIQESLRLLLDHGREFILTHDKIKPDSFLLLHLESGYWTMETIKLLVQRQGNRGLPNQNLTSCLHTAIFGNMFVDVDEIRDALSLLIEAGADVYERCKVDDWKRFSRPEFSVSVADIACYSRTKWYTNPRNKWYTNSVVVDHGRNNHGLPLKAIWMDALRACGYNAEEVISTSLRVEDLSSDDDDSMSNEEEESRLDESYCSTTKDPKDASVLSDDVSDYEDLEVGDEAFQETDSPHIHHDEQTVEDPYNVSISSGEIFDYQEQIVNYESHQEQASLSLISDHEQTIEDLDNDPIFSGEMSDYEERFLDHEGGQQQADFSRINHHEQSLLEGDAQVWGN